MLAALQQVSDDCDGALTTREIMHQLGIGERATWRLLDRLTGVEPTQKRITNRAGVRCRVPAYRLRK
jgi:hypothetical protein